MRHVSTKRKIQARRMSESLRMEPFRGKRPDSFEYMLDLARGITVYNFFQKRRSGRELNQKIRELTEELRATKLKEVRDAKYTQGLEKAMGVKRSYQAMGRQVGEVEDVYRSKSSEMGRRRKSPVMQRDPEITR